MNKKQKREFYQGIKDSSMPLHNQEFVFALLRDVLAPKPKELKIRKVKTKSPLMTLQEWEAFHGEFTYPAIHTWARNHKLCPQSLIELIEEFRTEMISKGKQYADFTAAFKTYLNKGYLSKKLPQVLWANSPYRKEAHVTMMQRGASI